VRRVALAAFLSVLAVRWLAAGESAAPEPEARKGSRALAPLRYLHERLADFLDIFELNVSVGRGAKADLKYGLLFFGLGDVRVQRYGLLDRRAGTWRELDTELCLLPLSLLASPVEQAARLGGAPGLAQDAHFVLQAGTDGFQHLDRKEFNGDPEFLLKDTVDGPMHTRWGDCFPIGAEFHLGVGARVTLRPLQLVDFLVGFAGFELDPWLNSQPEP